MGGLYEFKDTEYPFGREFRGEHGRAIQKARVAKGMRRLIEPAPDAQSPNLTGRYYAEFDDGLPAFYVFMNMAGIHVQILATPNLSGVSEELANETHSEHSRHLFGDFVGGKAELFHFKDGSHAGSLHSTGGSLALTPKDDPKPLRLKMINDYPTYFPHALKGAPDWVKAAEWFPALKPSVKAFLKILRHKLDFQLTEFFALQQGFLETGIPVKSKRDKRIELLNESIEKLFRPTGGTNNQHFPMNDADVPQYARIAQVWVHATKATFEGGVEGTYAENLSRALSIARRDGFVASKTGFIRRFLDVSLEESHYYKAQLVVGGVKIPVPAVPWLGGKIYGGSLHLESYAMPALKEDEEFSEDLLGDPEWVETYALAFVGASASKPSKNIGHELIDSSGSGRSDYNWRPKEVSGWFSIGDAGASAVAGVGFGAGVTCMIIEGEDSQPRPLVLDLSGTFKSASWGADAGPEASISVGYILGSKTVQRARPKPYVIKHREDYAEELASHLLPVHFETLGSAELSPAGMRSLRFLAALELPSFLDREFTRLAIVGNTDTVDTWSRNLELSYYRTLNVFSALRAILGKRLKIKHGKPKTNERTEEVFNEVSGKFEKKTWTAEIQAQSTRLRWQGELEANLDSMPDREPNPFYRRVDVILNNRHVLRMDAPET